MTSEQAASAGDRRSRRRDLLGLVISAVSLGGVVWWANGQERPTFPTSPEDLLPLALAIGLYAIATLIRGWRWHVILRHSGIEHAPADAYALTVVGYMGNTILPARGGEIMRVLLLGERTTTPRREILGTIVAERALDAVALIVLFAAVTWSQVAGAPVGQTPAIVSLAFVAVVALVLAFYIWLRRRGRLERFAAVVRPFLRASRLMVGKTGLVLLAVTIGVWFIEGAIFSLIARSLALDVSFAEGVFLVVLTSFFLSLPAAPGYLGTFDAALVFGLKALGIRGGNAVAYVVLVRFVLFVPITLAGLVLMLVRYGGLARLFGRHRPPRQADAQPKPQPSIGDTD